MTDSAFPRRVATQTRARKTVEKILATAAELVAERGADPVTMTDIASGAGVSIATIYQYFADKSAIMEALMLRHNEEVETILRAALDDASSLDDLIERLQRSYQVYADLHREDAFYRGIWSAVRADTDLQILDAHDSAAKGKLLFDIARPHYKETDEPLLLATCTLIMQLSMAAARFAMMVPAPNDAYILPAYQNIIAASLRGLERASTVD